MAQTPLINAPKTAKRGDTIEIKALILHPMEDRLSGPAPNGRMISAQTSSSISSARWNGEEIFKMAFSPRDRGQSVRVLLHRRARERGGSIFLWTGDQDFPRGRNRSPIAVT